MEQSGIKSASNGGSRRVVSISGPMAYFIDRSLGNPFAAEHCLSEDLDRSTDLMFAHDPENRRVGRTIAFRIAAVILKKYSGNHTAMMRIDSSKNLILRIPSENYGAAGKKTHPTLGQAAFAIMSLYWCVTSFRLQIGFTAHRCFYRNGTSQSLKGKNR
jgi:hypothetical protein